MRASTPRLIVGLTLALAACGPRNKDKLSDNELATAQGGKAAPVTSADRCGARTAQDEIRRQLFARAAEIRGANGDNYARIAGFAVLQLDGAAPVTSVAPGELADCRAHATLRLPPGLHAAGGRTSLGGDIGYTVAPGSDGTVTLGQSDAIAIPLATLTQSAATSAQSTAPTGSAPGSMMPAPGQLPPSTSPPPPPPPAPAPRPRVAPVSVPPSSPQQQTYGQPGFNCRRARSASEHAVCADPSLAVLDRRMADRYIDALGVADPSQNQLLHSTRDRFLAYRERCGTNGGCIASTYRGRMREIDDIMAGRWRGTP